ncbi:MAG: aspartate aminotransferase family protein [Pseudomonadota bacterium]
MAASALLPTYARAPVTIVEGEGSWLLDADGRRLLDFGSGIAVVGLGHRHPGPLAAAHAQLDRLWHASNLVWTEPQAALAERLAARFGGGAAFLCNSGTEAVEAALKLARKATGRAGAVALEGSFHGRTAGALALTGQAAKRAPFEPLLPGVRFATPNDVASLAAAIGVDTALVVLEPVLGEGGVVPLEHAFVEAAAALAAEAGALLCLDEVQTGVGRTGTFFAWEQLGVRPALVTLAKGLANGLPIGCLLAADAHAGVLAPGDHGSTFGGNPVSCAAACAVVDAVDEALLEHVREQGARLADGLVGLPGVRAVRGAGLLVGVVLDRPAAPVVDACRDAGLVVLTAGDDVLRLAPPLTVSADEVELGLELLAGALA